MLTNAKLIRQYAKGVNAKYRMQNAKLTKRYGRGGSEAKPRVLEND